MNASLTPAISVILPAYNAEKYIRESLESILSQTFSDFEFIIINNGSTDSTVSIVQSYSDPRIKLINNSENLGLIASLNLGLQAARGKYIARMDHDDISYPTRFEKEHAYLESHPDIVIVGTWSTIIDPSGNVIKIHKNSLRHNVIKYELLFGNSITHPSIMMRRKEILELGGYDPQWINTEDYNLYSRAVKKYELTNLPEPLLYYRVHGGSLTGSPDSQAIIHENTKKMIRKNISYYIPVTDEDHHLITQVLTARHPNPKLKFAHVWTAHQLHKKLYRAFLAKESAMLDKEDRQEIKGRYAARRKLLFTKYLVGKYHLLTRKQV